MDAVTGRRPGRRLVAAAPLLFLAGGLARAAVPRSSGPPSGKLLIVGGGAIGPVVAEAAYRAAGGPDTHWVVIPSAQSESHRGFPVAPPFIREKGNFSFLHTRDRAVADSEAFVAPLLDARAVWFDGGRQWRLADIYGGTRTERALHDVLARGGLIAGSSAGAAIQASFMLRGARAGNAIVVAPSHDRGFGFVRNVAIDVHIGTRHREADLSPVIAAHPGLLGIGIDEGTAILVQGNGFVVLGPSIVAITDGMMHGGKPYEILRQGDRFDLATWQALPTG